MRVRKRSGDLWRSRYEEWGFLMYEYGRSLAVSGCHMRECDGRECRGGGGRIVDLICRFVIATGGRRRGRHQVKPRRFLGGRRK